MSITVNPFNHADGRLVDDGVGVSGGLRGVEYCRIQSGHYPGFRAGQSDAWRLGTGMDGRGRGGVGGLGLAVLWWQRKTA